MHGLKGRSSQRTPITMPDDHAPHGGLQADLHTLATRHQARRRAFLVAGSLGLLGGCTSLALSACGGGGDAGESAGSGTSTASGSSSTAMATDGSTCSVVPTETEGPYPGDGSNTSSGSIANALMFSGIVRSDIRSSVDTAFGTAAGVPMTLKVKLVNVNDACAALEGWALYVWHCTADGQYSMYSSAVRDENFLRGVQATGVDGVATFTTVVPGCYSGRMPHIHFEVYRSLNTATSADNQLKTSQMALPISVCQTVYADTSTYASSATNLARTSFATDNIFADGHGSQLLTMTGNVTDGYEATLTVGLSV